MIECVRRTARNVKRWASGEMALRRTAAETLEAERQFRRIVGHEQLATLALAIERDLTHRHDDRGGGYPRQCVVSAGDRRPKFYDERDIRENADRPSLPERVLLR